MDYRLVPVKPGEYPCGEGQSWAEPSIEQAAEQMARLVDDPAEGRRLGARASAWIRRKCSPLALGLSYRDRLRALARLS